jgi:hypothetical protein
MPRPRLLGGPCLTGGCHSTSNSSCKGQRVMARLAWIKNLLQQANQFRATPRTATINAQCESVTLMRDDSKRL